jgi:hypothetical protein
MDERQCLVSLNRHRPMPTDADWTEECELLDEVRGYLTEYPSEEAFPLLLKVFGDGSGYGVHQLIERAVVEHPPSTVVPLLVTTHTTGTQSIKYWNAQIAENFPSRELIAPLTELCDSSSSESARRRHRAAGTNQESRGQGVFGEADGIG